MNHTNKRDACGQKVRVVRTVRGENSYFMISLRNISYLVEHIQFHLHCG
jgi:hypothetical protein